jgi:fimbrial chaperone protein
MIARRAVVAGLAVAAMPGVGIARTGGRLAVAPTLLELEAGRANNLIHVSNDGAGPLTAQVRLFAWRNVAGREALTPSAEVAFSPGQFVVAPGRRQVVRLLARTPPGDLERAYRLAIDQLPGLDRPGAVQMPVRMLVPLFVPPAGVAPREPDLIWSATADRANRRVNLLAVNSGRRRVRLAALACQMGGRRIVIAEGLAGYVVAGETWTWRIPLVNEPASLRVSARTERGEISAEAPLAYG